MITSTVSSLDFYLQTFIIKDEKEEHYLWQKDQIISTMLTLIVSEKHPFN